MGFGLTVAWGWTQVNDQNMAARLRHLSTLTSSKHHGSLLDLLEVSREPKSDFIDKIPVNFQPHQIDPSDLLTCVVLINRSWWARHASPSRRKTPAPWMKPPPPVRSHEAHSRGVSRYVRKPWSLRPYYCLSIFSFFLPFPFLKRFLHSVHSHSRAHNQSARSISN